MRLMSILRLRALLWVCRNERRCALEVHISAYRNVRPTLQNRKLWLSFTLMRAPGSSEASPFLGPNLAVGSTYSREGAARCKQCGGGVGICDHDFYHRLKSAVFTMEDANLDEAPNPGPDATVPMEMDGTTSSQAPPSTSVLSDPPSTDAAEPSEAPGVPSKEPTTDTATPTSNQEQQYSAQTESILKRINDNAANAAATGTPGWEAAKEQIMKDMATSDKFPTPTPPSGTITPTRGGRGGRGKGSVVHGSGGEVKIEGDGPQSATPRGRGRGGRPRGRGRGGGRGGKRKREDGSDGESDDSEVYSPVITTTKSGRNVQKPTSFVPPPPSPTSTTKKKRPYRRNPESAVCKICLRGTSPASNMIVFCDGCNTPYHRFCHHPPIDQAVVDEVDKEWYCKQCEKERVEPVPEDEVSSFIAAPGASVEQRQRYFASLPPGLLVTLLTKATTLKPDLPVFAPDFQARAASNVDQTHLAQSVQRPSNGHANPQSSAHISNIASVQQAPQQSVQMSYQAIGGAQSYQQPFTNAPANDFVPEGHPQNYPRPGYGLMRTLPPEQEDLQWLVEDDRYGVFNHYYQPDQHTVNAGVGGGDAQ